MAGKLRLPVALALLVLVSGCLSGAPSAGGAAPTATSTTLGAGTTTPGGTTATLGETTAVTPSSPAPPSDACVMGVSFWGLGPDAHSRGWAADQVAVGYTLPANASSFLVVYENRTVRGVARVSNANSEYPVAADGDRITLDEPLTGTRTIRVVSVADTNDNGVFDPNVDSVCRENGSVVGTGPVTVDFDALDATSTTSG